MMSLAPDRASAAVKPPPKRKRVDKACEYCRRKRLKCTTSQYPCSNCQLYGAECVYSTDARTRRAGTTAARREPTALENALTSQQVVTRPSPLIEHQDASIEVDAGSASINVDIAQATESQEVNDLMQLWNPPLDLPGTVFFEGLYAPPFIASENTRLDLMSYGLSSTPSASIDASPCLSLRGSRDAGGKVSGIETLAHKDPRGPSVIPPGLFIRKDTEDSNFIGLNSTGATTAFCLREALQSSRGLLGTATLDFLIEAAIHIDEAGYARSRVPLSRLPGRSSIDTAIVSYFDNVNSAYPIVTESSFRLTLEQLYAPDRVHFGCVEYSRFYLILAIGEMSQTQPGHINPDTEHSSAQYYQNCWSVLQECIAIPNVGTVQVLLLHVIFHMHCGKGGFAWVLCGHAIKIAQAVGLHRRSPEDFDLDEADVHLRSQLWWVAYRLDGFLSMTQGRPVSVNSLASDAQLLPLLIYSERPTSDTSISASDFYRWNSELAHLQHRFCNATNQASSTSAMLNELGAIDASLISWCSEIPIECRPGEEILVSAKVRYLAASLHLEYFNMLRAVHWAAFTCAHTDKDLVISHSNKRIMGCEAICLSASRSIVKTLNDSIFEDATYTRRMPLCLQTDYIIAALAVIYRSIFKSPYQISARSNLEHLRAGKIHLEQQMHSISFSPSLRNLFQAMLISAENLIYVDRV